MTPYSHVGMGSVFLCGGHIYLMPSFALGSFCCRALPCLIGAKLRVGIIALPCLPYLVDPILRAEMAFVTCLPYLIDAIFRVGMVLVCLP